MMNMWSEPTKNGKVKFVERYENPMTGKSHKVSVTMNKDTASTRKQAQIALDSKICESMDKFTQGSQNDELRLSELVKRYLKYKKNNFKEVTYKRDIGACNSIMDILGKDVLVSKLTATYVDEKLDAKGEEPNTTNERIIRLKSMIRWAYKKDYVSDIKWLDKLERRRDKTRKTKLQDKYLEKEELHTLLDAMNVYKWKLLTQFLVLSGMRIGEAIALERNDVNIAEKNIRITKTYDYINGHKTDTPKTDDSNRDVYIQPELELVCRQINSFMLQQKMKCGYHSDFYMCDESGKPIKYYAYNKYLREVGARVLDKPITITTHVMRHTHTALMAESGVNLETISRRLGHSDSKVTTEIYLHITEKMKEKDNEQFKSVKIL